MNLPLAMVIAFLVLTLIVGLYFSRKITTLREYAMGSKTFATATLVATVLATAFGGAGLIRNVQVIYNCECKRAIIMFTLMIVAINKKICWI